MPKNKKQPESAKLPKRRNCSGSFLEQQQPTVEQLAELQIYSDTIKELAGRVNRPLASLLTFITGFGLSHRLISPLSDLSKTLSGNLIYADSSWKIAESLRKWELLQLPKLLKSILFFFADLITRSADLMTNWLHGPVENVPLKQLNLQLHEQTFLERMHAYLSLMVQKGSASPEKAEYILQKLLQGWRKQYQDPDTTIKLYIYSFNQLIIDIEYYLLLYIMLVSASKYIVSPLLLKVFPHGVISPLKLLHSFRKNQIPLSNNEIYGSINEHLIIKRSLGIKRRKITDLSRVIALVGFLMAYSLDDSPPPYGVYKFMGDFLSCSQWIALISLSLFSTAWDGIFGDLYQLYLDYNKEKRMHVVEQSLNALSHEINLPDWNRVDNDDMGACYFHLSIFRRNTKRGRQLYQDIPISRLVKELVCVLYHYECINVIAYNKHELTLVLDQPLSGTQHKQIITSFKSRLASIKNKHKLICQLDELFTSIHVKPEYEIQEINQKPFVTNYNFIIQLAKIPSSLKEALYKQLKDCFGDNCSIQANESSAIVITHAMPIEQSRYESILEFLKDHPVTYLPCLTQTRKPTTTQNATEQKSISGNVIVPRVKRSKPLTDSPLRVSPDRLSISEDYKWQSGTYSHNRDSKVVKIRGAHNLFSLFKLKREDFPRCREKAYDHFKDITTTHARIVPKKNSQGIVSTQTPVKDKQGMWFIAKYKAKALGSAHGNIRVYARQEDDNQGHKLLVFNTVKLRSH